MIGHARRPTGIMYGDRVWPAVAGYDLAAAYYDEWYWQPFWIANERPLIIRELVEIPSSAIPAIDVGTGTGLYLSDLIRLGVQCVGVDASQAMLNEAKDDLPSSARLICASVERLPFPNKAFNLATACRVLSHVANIADAMEELGRVVNTGGSLILSDVSACHDYVATRIPTPKGDIHIETYKHSVEQLANIAEESGCWRVERAESVAYKDLFWKPQPSEYPAIDVSSARPVFFYGVLRRV